MAMDIVNNEPRKVLRGKGHKLMGILLTAMGALWFAHKMGWIPVHKGEGLAVLWPLVTMGVGLFVLFNLKPRDAQDNK